MSQNTAVAYCRMSTEQQEHSIESQLRLIKDYANRNDYLILNVYKDDGISGLNDNRPDFQRLLEDIAAGKIDCVIIKDLSRLGRDYIMTGYYTEVFFPENKVRYIAIGDQFDTADKNSSNNDFAPFKFIMNDLYAKDLSKKQRTSRNSKYLKGEYVAAYVPYGHRKDPNDKNHLVIDEEIAPIVRMIFEKNAAGMGRGTLRDYLNEAKIPTPLALMHMRGEKYSEYMEIPEHRYEWNIFAIPTIVKNELYLGNTVHLRYRKANHKSKMRKQAKEDQLVLQDTHEPIITEELWEAVQKRFVTHADMTFVHENIFMGLVRCADCGKALNYGKTPRHPTMGKRGKEQKTTRYLTCTTYTTHGKVRCTSHYTQYDMLCEIVKLRLNRIISMVKISEDRVRKEILKSKNQTGSLASEAAAKKLAKNDKRLSEIERIYTKLYEDRALKVVSDENFKMLSIKLQSEQKQLKSDNESLRGRMAEKEKTTEDIGNFIEVIKSMERIEVLDEEILNALINIGEKTTGEDGEVYQSVEVSYKFIGNMAF